MEIRQGPSSSPLELDTPRPPTQKPLSSQSTPHQGTAGFYTPRFGPRRIASLKIIKHSGRHKGNTRRLWKPFKEDWLMHFASHITKAGHLGRFFLQHKSPLSLSEVARLFRGSLMRDYKRATPTTGASGLGWVACPWQPERRDERKANEANVHRAQFRCPQVQAYRQAQEVTF